MARTGAGHGAAGTETAGAAPAKIRKAAATEMVSCACGMRAHMGLWVVRTQRGSVVREQVRCFRHLSNADQKRAMRLARGRQQATRDGWETIGQS